VVRACERQEGSEWFVVHTGVVHTGQHYSHHMDRVFFEQLELPEAGYNLDVGVRVREAWGADREDACGNRGDSDCGEA